MATKHRKRRPRKFNLRKVRVAANSAIGALASFDVVSNVITAAVTNEIRVMSVDASWTLVDRTAADDGQSIGLAHSDYTAAEIEECLEASASIDLGDKIAQEQANRLVREIGTFSGGEPTGAVLNDGMPIKTKLNWLLNEGDSLQVWIRNSSANVYTTGCLVAINGNLWVKDQ